MYRHLLVPIDGSTLDRSTVDEAVVRAAAAGAQITFFHAQADFGATADGALLHSAAPDAFTALAAGNARALLARAEAAARAGGVVAHTLAVVGDRPHEAILTAAAAQGCDLVFMASHGRRGIKGLLSGSVLQRVLQHTTLPVLVARIESNAPASDEQLAVAALLDEHRSLAAVMHGLQAVVKSPVPDFRLMRAMLYYIEDFPEKLHHPKEEACLFRLLGQRDKTSAALIEQLQVQHAEGAAAFAALRQALAAWEAGTDNDKGDDSGTGFARSLDRFTQGQWQHMRAEESLLLPAAHRHLSAQDWAEIRTAFSGHGDPRLARDDEASYDRLFAQLLNMAADRT